MYGVDSVFCLFNPFFIIKQKKTLHFPTTFCQAIHLATSRYALFGEWQTAMCPPNNNNKRERWIYCVVGQNRPLVEITSTKVVVVVLVVGLDIFNHCVIYVIIIISLRRRLSFFVIIILACCGGVTVELFVIVLSFVVWLLDGIMYSTSYYY